MILQAPPQGPRFHYPHFHVPVPQPQNFGVPEFATSCFGDTPDFITHASRHPFATLNSALPDFTTLGFSRALLPLSGVPDFSTRG